jgi:hypothetical protein
MHRLFRAPAGALILGLAACAARPTPADGPIEPAAGRPAEPTVEIATGPVAEPAADPLLTAALDRLVEAPPDRFHYEVVIDLGDDEEADALGPVVTSVDGDDLAVDPSGFAEVRRGAGSLHPEGDEAVGGHPTHRHRTVVHLDRVLDRVSDHRRALVGGELDSLADLIEELGGPRDRDELAARIWLADDGTLVRFELDVPVAEGTFGPGASARVTLDLYDDGPP